MKITAWHFLKEDYRLQFGDRKRVRAGSTVRIDGEPILCERGFHASRRLIDALRYAPGPILCRVRVGGTVVESDDKLVGTERYIVWTLDTTRILHEFACWCAETALKQSQVTDERCWNAITIKRLWLDGYASDDELDAARAAALAAAWDAAWDAARAAAWDAARDAAVAAARDAAVAAAMAAAMAAARDAAMDAQNRKLTAMVNAAEWA
jgi:hypothetical protein